MDGTREPIVDLVIVVARFVRVYAAIMHERERLHYNAYTCTNQATTDLSKLHA